MKAFVKGAALLLGVGLLSTHAQAQKVIIKDEEPNSILFISRDKAGDEIIRILNETQNQRFHEPGIPRFLLTDRKGRFALGIGGYVKATAEYDFGGISKDIDFYPALIPTKVRRMSETSSRWMQQPARSSLNWWDTPNIWATSLSIRPVISVETVRALN